jgi:hypothetical protein
MDFFNMPSFVYMLTHGFLEHEGNTYVSMDRKEGMLKKSIRQHGNKRRRVKEMHTSVWTQKKVC